MGEGGEQGTRQPTGISHEKQRVSQDNPKEAWVLFVDEPPLRAVLIAAAAMFVGLSRERKQPWRLDAAVADPQMEGTAR